MSAIVSTAAVVLRSVKFQESSRIVTFYTEKFGRMAGIIKGARRNPGRFGTSLQPMSQVSLVVYRKPGRDVQTVSQCDLAFVYRRIPSDLERMSAGLQMVELVTVVAHHEEENRELYELLSRSLRELDGERDIGWPLLYRFELGLASVLGFHADFTACAVCRRPEDGSWFPGGATIRADVERGGPLCPSCDTAGRRGIPLTPEGLRLLRALSPGSGFDPGDAGGGRDECVEKFLFDYYSYHLPGFKRLKSGDVFSRVRDTPGNF